MQYCSFLRWGKYLRCLPTVWFITMLMATVSPAHALTLLSDDFEGDSPGDVLDSGTVPINNWTKLTGNSAASAVTIVQDAGDPGNTTNVMESNPVSAEFIFVQNTGGFAKPKNLTLSMDARLLADGTGVVNINFGDDELGGANSTPLDRYGITIFEVAGDDTIALTKADGGVTTNIVGPVVPFSGFNSLQWHNYELQTTFGDTNDTLNVLIDGMPIFSNVLNSSLDLDPILFAYVGNGGGRQVRFDNFSLTTFIPVPEPSSMALLLLGLAGLGRRPRKGTSPR